MPTTEQLAKVKFDDKQGNIETLWAFPLGGNRYRLDNTPWFAYGVSWQDVIEAISEQSDDFPKFVRVVEKSGYRTVRLILNPSAIESTDSKLVLDRLQAMGCSYEGANQSYIAIDIPPAVDLMAVRDYLISTDQQWEHADPPYDVLFPNDTNAN